MQLVKIVITLLAVGGPSYALFQFPHAPPWVKVVLAFVLGVATVIGTIIVLPQALDALETTINRVTAYVQPSEEDLRLRAEEAERQRAAQAARERAAQQAEWNRQEDERKRAAEQVAAAERKAAVRREAAERARQAEQDAAMKRIQDEEQLKAVQAAQRLAEIERRRREQEARERQQSEFEQRNWRQYQGGVIPCSQDDQSFINGRWVPNCR